MSRRLADEQCHPPPPSCVFLNTSAATPPPPRPPALARHWRVPVCPNVWREDAPACADVWFSAHEGIFWCAGAASASSLGRAVRAPPGPGVRDRERDRRRGLRRGLSGARGPPPARRQRRRGGGVDGDGGGRLSCGGHPGASGHAVRCSPPPFSRAGSRKPRVKWAGEQPPCSPGDGVTAPQHTCPGRRTAASVHCAGRGATEAGAVCRLFHRGAGAAEHRVGSDLRGIQWCSWRTEAPSGTRATGEGGGVPVGPPGPPVPDPQCYAPGEQQSLGLHSGADSSIAARWVLREGDCGVCQKTPVAFSLMVSGPLFFFLTPPLQFCVVKMLRIERGSQICYNNKTTDFLTPAPLPSSPLPPLMLRLLGSRTALRCPT